MTHSSSTLPPAPALVVMGVSGSGKSTVARLLSERLGRPMLEGDEMHSAEAVAKMGSGHPLTDEDRWPWLRRIRAWIVERSGGGTPGVVACSALRRPYRDLLAGDGDRAAVPQDGAAPVVFVYLHVPREELHRRLQARKGHYMKANMLDSQLDTLEPPEPDERAVTVDATGRPEAIADEVLQRVAALA